MRLQRYLKEATHPLPKIEDNEIGMMTKDEFLEYQNDEHKYHPDESYDFTIESLNQDYSISQIGGSGSGYSIYQTSKNDSYIIKKDDEILAVFIKDTLYHLPKVYEKDIPLMYYRGHNPNPVIELDVKLKKVKKVKYLTDVLKQVSDIIKKNYKDYPVLVQRIKNFEGEYFEVRAEKKLVKDKGINIAMLNSKGEVVAVGQNEWGATLISVAREYRGKGIANPLTKIWFDWNPGFKSGGFTAAGEKMSIGVWADKVRKFLEYGWFTELIKQGKITKERVNKILGSLPEKKKYKPVVIKKTTKPEPLYMIDYPHFVIYDKSIYDIEDYYSYDGTVEDKIYAYGFLRESNGIGTFVFSIDYEPEWRKTATTLILQMAKDEGEKIYYGKGYTDILELKGIKIKQDGDYIELAKNEMNLRQLGSIESRIRKKMDKFGEIYIIILETADKKWR